MLARLIEWVKRIFGVKPQSVKEPVDDFAEQYENVTAENMTAVIAGRLATLTVGQSTAEITGDGKRAAFLKNVLSSLWNRLPGIAAQAYGKGGKVLLPLLQNGTVSVSAVDQSRVTVNRTFGGKIMAATVLAESAKVGTRTFFRLMDYALDTQSGMQTIAQRCVDEDGHSVPLASVPDWEGLEEETTISGTDRLLMGWVCCPTDNRGGESCYGVPITWGASQELKELSEHMKWYRREFKLARPMLGLDSTLWRDLESPAITDVKRTAQDDETPFIPVQYGAIGAGQQWQHFAPDIRFEAFEGRLQSLYRRLEKACGLSQGILTERQNMNYATKDEVRSAMYDTFSVVSAMRSSLQKAIEDVMYAADVLCERFALTPAGTRGDWELSFDWDMSLLESTTQTFQQLSELQSAGLITAQTLVQWVLGASEEEAAAEVEAAKKERKETLPLMGFEE